MPIKHCTEGGMPGYKWGDSGKCYTYMKGDKGSMSGAKGKAISQGLAATGGKLDKIRKRMRIS